MVKVNLITWDKSLSQHCPGVMRRVTARRRGLGGTWGAQGRLPGPPGAGVGGWSCVVLLLLPPLLFCRALAPWALLIQLSFLSITRVGRCSQGVAPSTHTTILPAFLPFFSSLLVQNECRGWRIESSESCPALHLAMPFPTPKAAARATSQICIIPRLHLSLSLWGKKKPTTVL